MSALDDGGPAFPELGRSYDNDERRYFYDSIGGMTLRDYFAAKAMQGLLANPGGPIQANGMSGWGLVNCSDDDAATVAYRMADAMLKARQS